MANEINIAYSAQSRLRGLPVSRVVNNFQDNPLRLFAALIIALGIALNVRVLGFLFAPDGFISSDLRTIIWIGQAVIIGVGVAVFTAHRWFEIQLRRWVRSRPRATAVLVGIVGSAIVLLTMEACFHAYNVVTARYRPPEAVRYSASLWQPSAVCESKKTIGDKTIYDVTYRLDQTGARITPDSIRAFTGRDAVFFGGSFTFGQGVEDAETLPNQFARCSPGWRVMNLGFPGYGPSQMLERVLKPETLDRFADNKLIVLDIFIPEHVRRTIGSMRIATTWGKGFPLFELTSDDRIERHGTMVTGRPYLAPLYDYLAREPIMKCFNVDIPVHVRDCDLALTARISAEAKAHILAQHPNADFRVVLFPDRPNTEFPAARIIPFLEAVGIQYIDYSNRLHGEEGIWIPHDCHPTAKTYAAVAQWLAEDLGVDSSLGDNSRRFLSTD